MTMTLIPQHTPSTLPKTAAKIKAVFVFGCPRRMSTRLVAVCVIFAGIPALAVDHLAWCNAASTLPSLLPTSTTSPLSRVGLCGGSIAVARNGLFKRQVLHRAGGLRMQEEGDDSYVESTDAYSENSVSVGYDDQEADKVKKSAVETRSDVLALCAGLDRGSSASREDRDKVDRAVRQLEGMYDSAQFPWPSAMDGSWRLVYSSAFSPGSGSGGGASSDSLPIFQTPDRATGFPGGLGPLSPVKIGAVFQEVSFANERLDNVVEFTLRVPGISLLLPQTASVVRASLVHKLERVMSGDKEVRIILKDIEAKYKEGPLMGLAPPPLTLPVIQAISEQGPGVFSTTYVDDALRVSRGDRGEMRVFTKEAPK